MEKYDYRYFIEKSHTLIRSFIIGKGDAKSRLLAAEFELQWQLSFTMPADTIKLKNKILKYINKKPASKIDETLLYTSFQNSIFSIRNSTASKIIGYYYDYHLTIISHYNTSKK